MCFSRGFVNILLVLYLALALAQVVDAAATLVAIDGGAEEANPVMAYFLTHGGVSGFVVAKLLMTWPGLLFLYWHRHRSRVRTWTRFIAVVYVLVLAWHGVNLS